MRPDCEECVANICAAIVMVDRQYADHRDDPLIVMKRKRSFVSIASVAGMQDFGSG
jgi:hypothetical protein